MDRGGISILSQRRWGGKRGGYTRTRREGRGYTEIFTGIKEDRQGWRDFLYLYEKCKKVGRVKLIFVSIRKVRKKMGRVK